MHPRPGRSTLPADLGRTYAAVSGAHNPIHLYPLTAKALGFPRQIAHGMWAKARCVAALENRLPDAVRVEVAFKKPVRPPGRVAFGSAALADGYAFSLTRPDDGAPTWPDAPPRCEPDQPASRRGNDAMVAAPSSVNPAEATTAASKPTVTSCGSWAMVAKSVIPHAAPR